MTFRSAAMIAALLVFGSAARAVAQEAADTASLPDLIITGTPVPVRPEALTAATTVIDGEDLRRRGIRQLHEALREVPGLVVVQQGSYGAVTSLFARGGESDYVKVMIDGVPVNQPGGGFDFATLTTEAVDRIEVVRGPASVVHGSDAMTGVVHVITRAGGARRRLWVGGGGGNHGTYAVEGGVEGGGARAGWSAAGSRFGSGGTYAFNNEFANTVANGRLVARPDERTTLGLAVRGGWNRAEFPTDGAGVPADSNQFSDGHTITAALDASRRLYRILTATAAITLADTRLDFDDRADHGGDTTGFAFISERRTDVRRVGARAGLDVRPWRGTALSFGAHFERDRERQQGSATSNFGAGPFTETQPPFDRTRWNRGWYLQATADLESGVGATAGVRLDDNEAFGDFVTARAGLAYRLATRSRLRASIGTGFKAPTFAENFAASPFEVGNPDLNPERSRSWEFGAEHGFARGALVVHASWFDQRFRDLIQYVPAAPGEPTYVNLGEATARGLESGAAVRAGGGVSIAVQWTYLETKVTDGGPGGSPSFADGERLIRRPAHSGRAAVTLRRAAGTVAIGATVIGRRDDVDFGTFERVTLPAHAIVDIAADVPVLSRPALSLRARLDNALNEAYETVAGYPGRRRAVFVGVRLER